MTLSQPDHGPVERGSTGSGAPEGPGPAGAVEEDRFVLVDRHELDALRYQALHDPLTDLPNRALLEDRVEQAILGARRSGGRFAVLALDLNGFKAVNDTLGHQSGDIALQRITERLRRTLRESDTIGRLGGDEFSVLLPGTGEQGAAVVAHQLLGVFHGPVDVEGRPVQLGASIGIAVFPDDAGDLTSLFAHADRAMYAAKRQGIGLASATAGGGRSVSSGRAGRRPPNGGVFGWMLAPMAVAPLAGRLHHRRPGAP